MHKMTNLLALHYNNAEKTGVNVRVVQNTSVELRNPETCIKSTITARLRGRRAGTEGGRKYDKGKRGVKGKQMGKEYLTEACVKVGPDYAT